MPAADRILPQGNTFATGKENKATLTPNFSF